MRSHSLLEKALLIVGDYPSTDDRRAERLLEFFGVSYKTRKGTDLRLSEISQAATSPKVRLLCKAETFGHVLQEMKTSHGVNGFGQQIHSVFLYSDGNTDGLANIVSQLIGSKVLISRGAKDDTEWHITDDPEGLCGAMRGLCANPSPATVESYDFLDINGTSAIPLVSTGSKTAFLKVIWGSMPVFVTSAGLIDIDPKLEARNFDVRDHLFSAVPIVSYIRWAFPRCSWNAPEPSACLVIDDPLLKARYGFVRFHELLTLMKKVRFSTSIAF